MNMPDIKDFYERKAKMKVAVKGFSDPWNVDLHGWDGEADCQVGHFGYNRFFRTSAAMHKKPYKTVQGLIKGILHAANDAEYELQRFDILQGDKTFSIQL